jgi:hypothetical protein
MIFTTLVGYYADYLSKRKIKRYITRASLVFGKTLTVPVLNFKITANHPANNKLQIFNSNRELTAGKNDNGVKEFIDTKSFSEIKNIIVDPSIIKELMEYDGNPYKYITTYDFNASLIYKGQQKRFRYKPSQMMMVLEYTSDEKVYEKIQAAAEFEKVCAEFVTLSQRNTKLLFSLQSSKRLSQSQKQQLDVETLEHIKIINSFKNKMPEGFFVQTKNVQANQVSGAIGIIPVIVWIVVIIVSGIVAMTAYYTTRKADIEILKTNLNDRYQAIMSITDEKMRNEAFSNSAESTSETVQNNANNTGMFGQIKQIALILGGAFVVGQVIPLFSKNKK